MSTRRARLITKALKYLKKARRRRGGADRMTGQKLGHVLQGELKRDPAGNLVGTGYHHRPGGHDLPNRRTGAITATHPNGVYDAKPEYRNPKPPPDWVPKKFNATNTYFPDGWSAHDVDEGISEAFKSGKRLPDGKWYGEHNGVYISGYYDTATGAVGNGFPVSPTKYHEARQVLGK